jgi:CPA1 family monovalent cation:H+ antiporter
VRFTLRAEIAKNHVESLQLWITFFVALLGAVLLIGVLADRLRLPYSVALLLAALPLEVRHAETSFAPSLLLVFLPALIFEAAWNLEARSVAKVWPAIVLLAVPGVVFTALVIGGALSLTGQLPFVEALLLGTILAATDPIAVIALFKRLDVPKELATIVEGESLFNDGVALVLYGATLASISTGAALQPGLLGLQAIGVSLGGGAIGFAAALLVSQVLRGVSDAKLQIVATVFVAYGSYLAADHLHVSGLFAALVAGIALRWFEHFPTSSEATAEVDGFWAVLAFFANSLVFLLVGLRIQPDRIFHEPILVLGTLFSTTAARLFIVYGGLPLVGLRKNPREWQHVIALAGMRGALSLALALSLPDGIPFRAQIIDAVFGVVTVTLIAQGLAIGPVLKRLRP